MKVNDILKEDLENSIQYKAAEQAFELLSKTKRSLGRPVTLEQDKILHRAILDYLGQ